ncbi:MAG: lysophospholipid acyltransferase family protein [Actinomycetota bacterium]
MADGDNGYGRHQRLAKRVVAPVFRLLWDLDVSGAENVPADGPAVLCPNHLAAIDSFVVPAVLRRSLIYVGKAEYLDDWKTRWLFPALGMIPIDRRGGDHATAALDAARRVLTGGGLFGIYPEGTRSRTGRLHKGHTGAARLAIETGAPIIPVGLKGTADIQPVDSPWPRPFRTVEVHFGDPIDVERYRHRQGDHVVYRELIDEVMFEIAKLSGQDYDGRYARDVKAGEAVSPTDHGAAPAEGPMVKARSSADVLVTRPLPEVGLAAG